MNLGEQIWCVLSQMSLETLLPYGPMLRKKDLAKIQHLKFHNSFNNFGRYHPYEYV